MQNSYKDIDIEYISCNPTTGTALVFGVGVADKKRYKVAIKLDDLAMDLYVSLCEQTGGSHVASLTGYWTEDGNE